LLDNLQALSTRTGQGFAFVARQYRISSESKDFYIDPVFYNFPMKRPLNVEEQKTAAQIRTFVTHAREALNVDDLDGASTLSAKAHVLLLKLSTKYSDEMARVLLINWHYRIAEKIKYYMKFGVQNIWIVGLKDT
jgi:YhcG PDDEXK nuclease domain